MNFKQNSTLDTEQNLFDENLLKYSLVQRQDGTQIHYKSPSPFH